LAENETAVVWSGGVGWLPSNIRLGHAAGSVRLSEISLRVSHVFRPVIVRSPMMIPFFFHSHILFWRPATLHARPSRIHYLVKEENGLSINVNAWPLKRNGKKRCRRIILDYTYYSNHYVRRVMWPTNLSKDMGG